jgi:hypothetical protein
VRFLRGSVLYPVRATISARVLGHDCGGELRHAIQKGTAVVAESEGRSRSFCFVGRVPRWDRCR